MTEPRYRVGGKLGRTVYQDNELIGLMDTRELGALVVDALNARDRFLTAERRPTRDMTIPQSCQDENGEACDPKDCMINGPHYVSHPEVPLLPPGDHP